MLIKLSQKIRTAFALILILYGNTLAQECKSKAEIIVNKDDAMIFIDSVFVGNGKVKAELDKGDHFLWIKESLLKWNQQEIRDTLRIVYCSKDYFFRYQLKPKELFLNLPINSEIRTSQKSESFFSSNTFKILLGSAALFGGVAAHFKIQADKKYDEYLRSKNLLLLDEVERLDLYSGIAFGLLQINFGFLIYKFLTE